TALAEPPSLSARWRDHALPFALTGDQARAIAQIDEDLAQPRPMQRLLMGEVGSGKTVVALHAMLRGATPARRRADILAKLASGELSLIVGTHALIEPDVVFRSLALAVIDEQHRF